MKKFFNLIMVMVVCFSLVGCTSPSQEAQKIALEEEIASLKEYKQSLLNDISSIKEENNIYTYVVEFEVKQVHYNLDISDHVKDSLNALTFTIPVSKEFYNSIEKNDVIDDSFRMGSFLMKGSFGSWKIKVVNKYIQEEAN